MPLLPFPATHPHPIQPHSSLAQLGWAGTCRCPHQEAANRAFLVFFKKLRPTTTSLAALPTGRQVFVARSLARHVPGPPRDRQRDAARPLKPCFRSPAVMNGED